MGCTTPPPGASAGRFVRRTPPRHPSPCSTRNRTPDRRAVPSAVIAPGPYLRVVRDPQVPARASAVPCTVIAIGAELRVPRGRERAAGAGPGPSGAALRSARGFGIPAPHATHPAPGRVYGTLTFARQTFGRLVHAIVGIRAAGSGRRRADSQDRMDHRDSGTPYWSKVDARLIERRGSCSNHGDRRRHEVDQDRAVGRRGEFFRRPAARALDPMGVRDPGSDRGIRTAARPSPHARCSRSAG